MLDHEPLQAGTTVLQLHRVVSREAKIDVHRRAVAHAAEQPRVKVDEHGAYEDPLLERGVARDVHVADVKLNERRRARAADEGVHDQPTVERRLDVWRLGGIEGGAIDYRAVQGDRLHLPSRYLV